MSSFKIICLSIKKARIRLTLDLQNLEGKEERSSIFGTASEDQSLNHAAERPT